MLECSTAATDQVTVAATMTMTMGVALSGPKNPRRQRFMRLKSETSYARSLVHIDETP